MQLNNKLLQNLKSNNTCINSGHIWKYELSNRAGNVFICSEISESLAQITKNSSKWNTS